MDFLDSERQVLLLKVESLRKYMYHRWECLNANNKRNFNLEANLWRPHGWHVHVWTGQYYWPVQKCTKFIGKRGSTSLSDKFRATNFDFHLWISRNNGSPTQSPSLLVQNWINWQEMLEYPCNKTYWGSQWSKFCYLKRSHVFIRRQ